MTQTITPEGISILWPPNAVLLSAFLLSPYRQWPLLGVAALIAECIADVPTFPLWAAVAFGLTNLFEVSLAAWLICRAVGNGFDFDRLKRGAYFLLYGPLLASSLAALFGAAVYVLLGRNDSSFLSLWRLWWFGDALGLLLLTPLIVVLWRWLDKGLPRFNWPKLLEIAAGWLLLVLVGINTFPQGVQGELGFHLTPIVLLPFSVWAAVRFGIRGAAMTVTIIAVMAIGFMVRGIHPYSGLDPQLGVWLMQEYLAVVAALSIGLAILLHEIKTQSSELERRVSERSEALQRSKDALEIANARLNELASTDYLTGIANRRYFHDIAQRELARLAGGGGTVSLIMFDLDHFKQVNDRFGHETGDRVLNDVVNAVQQTVRPMDLFGRFGGEEFLILLPDTPQAIALEVAERIRKKIEAMQSEHHGHSIRVTVSLGVVEWNGNASLDALIRSADHALLQAKESGRNRVQLASEVS
ncbi:MAG: diguanylate cyclase [Gammaproteobacteria bacterium]|nr:diguanylate cyclase [Gammaproteobacteria bacterium]